MHDNFVMHVTSLKIDLKLKLKPWHMHWFDYCTHNLIFHINYSIRMYENWGYYTTTKTDLLLTHEQMLNLSACANVLLT